MTRSLLSLAATAATALTLNGCVIVTSAPETPNREAWRRPENQDRSVASRPSTAPIGCSGGQRTAQQIFAAAKDGVAVVETADGQGSAFVVDHADGRTLLLTNSHVVEGYERVRVKWNAGGSDPATVVADAGGTSPSNDLALLEVHGQRGVPLQISSGAPEVGQTVYVIGAPRGLEFSLSSGVVSQVRDGGEIVQTDAAINSGNSGGPVLDDRNCVVGMATFIMRDSQGLNFAVSSQLLRPFLTSTIATRVTPFHGSGEPDSTPDPDATELPRTEAPEPPIAAASCFFLSYRETQGEDIGCSVTPRTNTNGHTVYDVGWSDGYRSSYVFWADGVVEILSEDGVGDSDTHMGRYRLHSDGVEISSNEGSITFLPELDPQLN